MTDPVAAANRAQARASDPRISAWVSANAGSGKTHVLVNRVIRLLLDGAEPERILCLTFTRAAAAEMARRLFDVLSTWTALDDEGLIAAIHKLSGQARFGGDLKAARRLFARALETPGGLKIQTIHAFCERLLQRFPVEAGVAPGFRVLEDHESRELLAEARAETVAEASAVGAPGSDAMAVLVGYAGEDSLDDLLRELLGRRVELKRLHASDETLRSALAGLCGFLGVAPEETPQSLALATRSNLDEETLRAAAACLDQDGGKTAKETAARIAAALTAPDDMEALARLKQAFLTGEGKRRAERGLVPASVRKSRPDLGEAILAHADLVDVHADRERALAVRDATMALLALGERIIGRYEAKKLRLGRYDYDDLIVRTRGLLSEFDSAAWVLYRLDGGLDHILVDEAQDTSREQWQIIAALAAEFFAGEGQRDGAERTVFAVGDRKQSIFSFQGADPDAFDEMQAHFAERVSGARRAFETVPLEVSFRSTQDVLDAVDAVFANAGTAAGVVGGDAGRLIHSAVRSGEPGLIEIWEPLPRDKAEPASPWEPGARVDPAARPRKLLCARVADMIRGWLDTGEMLAATGERILPGHILILLRQRTTFMDMLVKALKLRGIPVAGADRLRLGQHIAVQDVLSLLRFAVQPEDDLSLAEVLKSPLVRRDDGRWIEDDDLMAIAAGRGETPLWTALRMKAEAGAPYRDAVERLSRWTAAADFEPPYEFLAGVLGRDGGRKAFLERLGHEAGEPLDALLARALDFAPGEPASLRGFLAFMESEGGEVKRDTDQVADEVRVMTVHGAKGLEAPIVILPDTCEAPDGRHDPAVLTAPGDDGGGLPLWRLKKADVPACVEALKEYHRKRAREEYRRLLYVAMTRARDRLYVCGAMSGKEPNPESWHSLVAEALKPSASELRGPDGALYGWRIVGSATPRSAPAGGDAQPAPAGPLPAWATAPAPMEAGGPRWLRPSDFAGEVGAGERVSPPVGADGALRYRRGRLVHRLLQSLPDLPPGARREAAERFLARAADDLDDSARSALADEALAILDAPSLGPLFGPGSLAEVPVAADLGGGVRIAGQIDRLAVTDAEVIVADYKTNRPPPERVEDVDAAYIGQLAAYRAAVSAIYPGRAVRCVLVWTDGARVMEIPAAMLDAASAHA